MTVSEEISRERVYGFLHAENGKIVNGRGEEFLPYGMGIGNWLLPEGYMWRFGAPYDRPRTIEALVRELCGSEYAASFWKRFRENYITEADVRAMAEAGFNSVRLPVNWRVVMENEPGIRFKEDGLALIDRFVDWCEKYRIYVVLDLHGAPGGQTGHNIDDSFDNMPRLLMDTESDSREKAIALWCEFARRYKDRWIVGMYDLLNEPVRTDKPNCPKLPDLREALKAFYRDCIAAVRKIDSAHMFSIESYFWASRADFFTEKLDDNMCVHFHRYWCSPRRSVLDGFIRVREELSVPLFLGESGENTTQWFAAMYPLCLSLDIGVNIWPWKKMETTNSPCSVREPKEWKLIQGFMMGGPRPSYAHAQAIFDEYLENIRLENCTRIPDVIPSIARRPGCSFKAADWLDANDRAAWIDADGNPSEDWAKTLVRMEEGGEASWSLSVGGTRGTIAFTPVSGEGKAELYLDGKLLADLSAAAGAETAVPIPADADCTILLRCTSGTFVLDSFAWRAE